MDAASIIKIEKGVDRSASTLFGLACGYAAYVWFSSRAQEPVLGLEATAAFLLGYLLSLRGLTSIQPQPRKVPVPIFDVREVEPMAPERAALHRVRPSAEQSVAADAEPIAEGASLEDSVVDTSAPDEVAPVCEAPVVETFEALVDPATIELPEPLEEFGAADSTELELTDQAEPEGGQAVPDSADEAGPQDSRVVHLFDPASMPTPEEMISRIDRHLEGQPSAAQSADAAQALHEALAELRRSIR